MINLTSVKRPTQAFTLLLTLSAYAQPAFDCGSDGSDGALLVPANTTVSIPAERILNFTSVTIEAGGRAVATWNPTNLPCCDVRSQGPVIIQGVIEISGEDGTGFAGGHGGPGGGDGGNPTTLGVASGAGYGPGAGKGGFASGGAASHRTVPEGSLNGEAAGSTYGNPLQIPLSGGSGGAGSDVGGGGGGGGDIIISSNVGITLGQNGAIIANGGRAFGGGDGAGSGGSVRLVAPRVDGTGIISVTGGPLFNSSGNLRGQAGHGYVRIDTLDRSGLALRYEGSPASVGSAMLTALEPAPTLRITEAAGIAVPQGSAVFTIVRPQGADPNITVKVRAGGFGAKVPVQLYATPDSGPRAVSAAELDNQTQNPAEHTFNLTVPMNVRVTLQVFGGKDLPSLP